MPLEGAAPAQQPITSAVDHMRIVHVDDSRGRQRVRPARLSAAQERRQPAWLWHCVVVQQHDEAAARLARTGIVAAGKTTILSERDQPHPRKSLADENNGSIGRSV